MSPEHKQICQQGDKNTFLFEYKHKEARGGSQSVFLCYTESSKVNIFACSGIQIQNIHLHRWQVHSPSRCVSSPGERSLSAAATYIYIYIYIYTLAAYEVTKEKNGNKGALATSHSVTGWPAAC